MKGIKISFNNGEALIDTDNYVENFDATVQNALVNIATRAGTDRIYADKGTSILSRAVAGKIVGMNEANHQSQLAALDTLYFSRKHETSTDSSVKLGAVAMKPVTYDGASLKLNVAFTDLAISRTVGIETTL